MPAVHPHVLAAVEAVVSAALGAVSVVATRARGNLGIMMSERGGFAVVSGGVMLGASIGLPAARISSVLLELP